MKREESEEIDIPTTDGAGDVLPAERKTRGLKIQYQVDEISDSDDSAVEEEVDTDGEYNGQGEADDGVDDYMSDDEEESESEIKGKSKAMGRQVVRRLQTTSTSTSRNANINRLQVPANTPIGLTGWKVLHSGFDDRQPVLATRAASASVELVSLTSLDAEDTEYESASEEIDKDESEMRTPHGAQLHTELAVATLVGDSVGTDDVHEDVVESIEDSEEPRKSHTADLIWRTLTRFLGVGFLARMLPWWK